MTYQEAIEKSNEVLGTNHTPDELIKKANELFEEKEKYLCINDYFDFKTRIYKKGQYYELVEKDDDINDFMYFSKNGKIFYYMKSSCVFAYFDPESFRKKRKNKIKKYLEI